jgi:sugar lactone lactonase YvrE
MKRIPHVVFLFIFYFSCFNRIIVISSKKAIKLTSFDSPTSIPSVSPSSAPTSIVISPETEKLFVELMAGSGRVGDASDEPLYPYFADLNNPAAIWKNPIDNSFFIADSGNGKIRMIDSSQGYLQTIVNAGKNHSLSSLTGDREGRYLYYSDEYIIWKYDLLNDSVVHYAGNRPERRTDVTITEEIEAAFSSPAGLWLTTDNLLYVSDRNHSRIKVVHENGNITTIAGNGTNGFDGIEGIASLSASLSSPHGLYVDPDNGIIYFADSRNNRIRMITNNQAMVFTFAGGGTMIGNSHTIALATSLQFNYPFDVKGDGFGNIFITETNGFYIWIVDLSSGMMSVYAGNGQRGFSSERFPGDSPLSYPAALWISQYGSVYFSEIGSNSSVFRTYFLPVSPTFNPTSSPSSQPSNLPTSFPSNIPSSMPSTSPSSIPTIISSRNTTSAPRFSPSSLPSSLPSDFPSSRPSGQPTVLPTTVPSKIPSSSPSVPSSLPSSPPSGQPTLSPSTIPSRRPSSKPSCQPVATPTGSPTSPPSANPSQPSSVPSSSPTNPTSQPTSHPSHPTRTPTLSKSCSPTKFPSFSPSFRPSTAPSFKPNNDQIQLTGSLLLSSVYSNSLKNDSLSLIQEAIRNVSDHPHSVQLKSIALISSSSSTNRRNLLQSMTTSSVSISVFSKVSSKFHVNFLILYLMLDYPGLETSDVTMKKKDIVQKGMKTLIFQKELRYLAIKGNSSVLYNVTATLEGNITSSIISDSSSSSSSSDNSSSSKMWYDFFLTLSMSDIYMGCFIIAVLLLLSIIFCIYCKLKPPREKRKIVPSSFNGIVRTQQVIIEKPMVTIQKIKKNHRSIATVYVNDEKEEVMVVTDLDDNQKITGEYLL